MNVGRSVRRVVRTIVHNWPLKVAAIVVATLLYAGLVVSQDSTVYPGPVTVLAVNQPDGSVVTNDLRDVTQIRYIAPADVGRLAARDFRATVDVSAVKPDGNPVNVRVSVEATDPRVTVLEWSPRSIQVVLDESIPKVVDVIVDRGTPPLGLDVGTTTVDPARVTITGPSAAVNRVVAVRASTPIDPSGLDVDREVEPDPIDAAGEIVPGVDVEPRTVHVTIPVFTNKESRTLPVNVMLAGTPAAGFRIASVVVTPLVVSVEGDQDQLTELIQADTAPVPVFGATSDVDATVTLALPAGVVPIGAGIVTVTVRIEAVTETRTFTAGIRLDGQQPGLAYDLAPNRVLLILFGSVADLDRLASAPLVVGVNVATLEPGTHEVPVVPSLPTGVTVANLSPETVTVIIRVPATPTPPPASPSASPDASPGPSVTPAP
jgi:YbbR domain-containing protein